VQGPRVHRLAQKLGIPHNTGDGGYQTYVRYEKGRRTKLLWVYFEGGKDCSPLEDRRKMHDALRSASIPALKTTWLDTHPALLIKFELQGGLYRVQRGTNME